MSCHSLRPASQWSRLLCIDAEARPCMACRTLCPLAMPVVFLSSYASGNNVSAWTVNDECFVYKISGFSSKNCHFHFHRGTMSRKNRTQPSPEPEQSSLSSSSHENAFHSYQTPQSSSLYPHHYPPTYAVYTGEQGTYGHDIQAYTSYPLDSTQFSPQDLSTDRPQNSGLPWQGHDAEPTPDLLLEHPGFYGLPYPSYPEGQPLVSPTSRPPSTPHHVPLPSSDPPRSHPVDPMHIQGDNFHGELHAQRSPSTTQFSPYPSTPSSVNTSSPTSDSSQLSSPAMQDPTMALALPNISNSRDQKVPRPTKSIERRVLGAKINKNSKGKKPRRKLTPEERDKADAMRYYGACWRCKRYKKPV